MRFLNKLWARVFGYFWIKCPRCGKMFGGHEVKGTMRKFDYEKGEYWLTCCPPDEQRNRNFNRDLNFHAEGDHHEC